MQHPSIRSLELSLFAVLSAAICGWTADPPPVELGNELHDVSFESPRMAKLAKELGQGELHALPKFWGDLQGKGPLIEADGDDAQSRLITFLWMGDSETRRVNVQGAPSSGDFADWLERLGNTNLWYRTVRIPKDSRFAYFFQVNRPLRFPQQADRLPPLAPPQTDPLNPRKSSSSNRSLVELPDAPPQPWLKASEGKPQGRVREHKLTSQAIREAGPGFDHERRFAVYVPPNYDGLTQTYDLLVLFDGERFGDPKSDMPVRVILDNLIAEAAIAPCVAVFLYQSSERHRELGCSEPFRDFLTDELLPLLRKNYRVTQDAAHVTIGGMSAGGRMAAFCALKRSNVFGNVLSLSGGFEWWPGALEERFDDEPGWLTRQYVGAPLTPVRFYLAAGRFEHWFFPSSLLTENRRLRDVLRAKGYTVYYSEFSGGHDPVCWCFPFVEGLKALTHK